MNVLVIGAGFGKHYVRILDSLRSTYGIERIVLSRTTEDRAWEATNLLANQGIKDVIPVGIKNVNELNAVLDGHEITFTGIASKDPTIGDNIHYVQAQTALAHGDVLCEKPFARSGSPRNLSQIDSLRFDMDQTHTFGLELPYAIIAREIAKNELYTSFNEARILRFLWVTKGIGRDNVIDDLILHPYSLIPNNGAIRVNKVENNPEKRYASVSAYIVGSMDLKHIMFDVKFDETINANFMGFSLNNENYLITRVGQNNCIVKIGMSLEDAAALYHAPDGPETITGEKVLTIDNPLKANIEASLRHTPITGIGATIDAQKFLEDIYDELHRQ